MTEEKIEKGKELLLKLRNLKDQKERWQSAVGFERIEVKDCHHSTRGINDDFINFNELKLLTIAKIDRRIDAVQREFDEL